MLRELLDDLQTVEAKMQRVEKEIAGSVDIQLVERLCSIPGVDIVTAWTLLAELGADRGVFEGPKQAAS